MKIKSKLEWDSKLLEKRVYNWLSNSAPTDDQVKENEIIYFRSSTLLRKAENQKDLNINHIRTVLLFKVRSLDVKLTESKLKLRDYAFEDYHDILLMAPKTFQYTRFGENPNLPFELSVERTKSLIEYLLSNQDSRTLIVEKNKKIIGFVTYSILDNVVTIELGGCFEGYGIYFPLMMDSFLSLLVRNGFVGVIKVEVSSCNKAVMNYYIDRAFLLAEIFLDYDISQLGESLE